MTQEIPIFGGYVQHTSLEGMNAKDRRFADRIVEAMAKYGENPVRISSDLLAVNAGRQNYSTIDVTCAPGCLPAPFHTSIRIIGIQRCGGRVPAEALWSEYGQAIEDLSTRPAKVCDEMRRLVAYVEDVIAGTGMELLSYRPVAYGYARGMPMLDIVARISMIDETLQRRTVDFVIHGGWRQKCYLKREARAQAKRLAMQEGGLIADSIMAHALDQLTRKEKAKLESLLTEGNEPYQSGSYSEWTAAKMLTRGLRLPAEIETIRAKDGLISGRVRLSPDVSFNRKRLLIPGNIPISIAGRIAGSRLGDVVAHPWLPKDAIIEKAKPYENGTMAVYITPPHVHYPSGVPARQGGKES